MTGGVSPVEYPKNRVTLDFLGLSLSWSISIVGVHVNHVDWSEREKYFGVPRTDGQVVRRATMWHFLDHCIEMHTLELDHHFRWYC